MRLHGHIKDPVPLTAKRRGLSPGGRFPPSFIHQVIIITRLNKLYTIVCSRPEDGLRCRHGVNPPLKLKKPSNSGGFRVEKHGGDVIFFDKENNFK